jgi:excisionase family DNA binding protein
MSEVTGPKLAYTLRTAAEAVGCSWKHLERAINAGELRAKRDGRIYRITAKDLQAWLDGLPDAA